MVVSILVGFLLAGFVMVLARSKSAESRLADSPLLGKPAPAVNARLIDGSSFDLDSQAGRWVVVNFFATWCVPCREEHPELVKFATSSAGATIVSIAYTDDAATVQKFFDEHGGDWAVVDDSEGKIALDWGVRGVPESYLVSPTGFVVAKIIGGVSQDYLTDLISRLTPKSISEGVSE